MLIVLLNISSGIKTHSHFVQIECVEKETLTSIECKSNQIIVFV